MVLNKILKPILTPFTKDKWQSRNPEVRKKAIQEMPVSEQTVLSDIAMNDPDESIRALAANRLNDLDLLQTIIMKGTNETVKQAAQKRLFQLLSGLKHPVPDYEIREKMIRGSRNPALLEFIAANADTAELRELTIKRISRDPLLGDIALNDSNAHVRQLAAQQIAKRSTLERVAKQSRRKDKRVYKIVKTKLDRIIEDEQRPILLTQEVNEICDKLEKLYKRNRLLQEKTTFENYLARWSEIENFANEELTERYHNLCSQIITRIDELDHDKQLESETLQNLDKLISKLSNAVDDLLNARDTDEPDVKITDDREKIILNLGREWDETIKQLTSQEKINQLNSKFQAILDLAENHNDILPPSINSLDKTRSLVEQAEAMLNKKGYILEKTILALEKRFSQQLENTPAEDINELKQRFAHALSKLKDNLKVQQQNAEKFIALTNARISKIKSQITDGHVSRADKALHDLIKQIDKCDALSNGQKHDYHNNLRNIQMQLGDLSSWRNWAHDNERENLTKKAEQLLESAKNYDNLATEFSEITNAVKELRKQWKTMRSHTPEDLWQRFNTACNMAYELCIPFIDKQAEVRQLNLKAKQALCEQLENYIETMGWPSDKADDIDHSINWINVDKITKQARKEWSEIGFVERKEHKPINQRFDKDIDLIRHELKKVWDVNQEQFYQLIENVQALADTLDDDLPGAINKAKHYQHQWKQIGPVSSYQRNKLWKKFRKACDVIFNKRQESIEQKNSENTERLREKEAICENLEALNLQPLKRTDLEHAFNDIQKLWLELEPMAKSISKDVNKRYATAIQEYNQKLQQLIIDEQEQQLSIIRRKADLCTLVEASTDTSDEASNDFNAQWQELEVLPTAIESPLHSRFSQALASRNHDKEILKQAERENKRQFCLKHEILLAKESPSDEQQDRMAMQVELLNSNLGNHGSDVTSEHKLSHFELQLGWYAIHNFTQDQQLEERFNELLS